MAFLFSHITCLSLWPLTPAHSQLAHDGTMSLKHEALAFEDPIESQRLGGGADQKVTNAERERETEKLAHTRNSRDIQSIYTVTDRIKQTQQLICK